MMHTVTFCTIGIYTDTNSEIKVYDSHIHNHSNVQVYVDESNAEVYRTKVHHGQDSGLRVVEKSKVLVDGCELYEHADNVQLSVVKNSETVILNSTIHQNEGYGILFDDSKGAIEHCHVYGNKNRQISICNASDVYVFSTKIEQPKPAIQTSLLVGHTNSIGQVIDVNSHSLGIIAVSSFSGELYNSIILPKNTALPASKSERYYTTKEQQQYIELQITEGEGTDPSAVRIIGETRLELPANTPVDAPITISISYDRNGLIHARAKDVQAKTLLGELKINRTSNLSKEVVEDKKSKFLTVQVE